MKAKVAPLLLVPFREVRHDQPDDCLHYEEVERRGEEMHWQIPAHRHDSLHQLQFLSTGSVSGTIDGLQFHASAPVMLMVAPGSVHGFTYTTSCVGHQVTIPSATLRELLGDSSLFDSRLSKSFFLSPTVGAQRVLQCFEHIAHEFSGNVEGRAQVLLAIATLLAVEFIRHRGEQFEHERTRGARDALVSRYLALVEQHFSEHWPLDRYATALGVTRDHLSRICKSLTKKSALQLLQDRMLLEARRLLAYTPMPVGEIARQLGFEDPAYFTKSFGRALGHSPSEYRDLIADGIKVADRA